MGELSMRWHRFLRAATFVLGLALGLGGAVFIFSNVNPVTINFQVPTDVGPLGGWKFPGVSLWLVAIVPLLAGLVLGYFYQTPARMHHVREAFAHRHRVHELEKELKELRGSLDKVLAMPADDELEVPALPAAKVAEVTELPEEPAAADLLKDFPEEDDKPKEKQKEKVKAKAAVPAVRARRVAPVKASANGGAKRSRAPRKRVPAPSAAELN